MSDAVPEGKWFRIGGRGVQALVQRATQFKMSKFQTFQSAHFEVRIPYLFSL
jgi:hypothetical protein